MQRPGWSADTSSKIADDDDDCAPIRAETGRASPYQTCLVGEGETWNKTVNPSPRRGFGVGLIELGSLLLVSFGLI